MPWLSAILAALLGVVLIAFGWMPCCCGTTPTACCPGLAIPLTLHGVITLSGGNCGCANGDLNGLAFTMTYDPNPARQWWAADLGAVCSTMASPDQSVYIACNPSTGQWFFQNLGTSGSAPGYLCIVNSGQPFGLVASSATCSPFQLVFSATISSAGSPSCPCNGRTWTLTVTF